MQDNDLDHLLLSLRDCDVATRSQRQEEFNAARGTDHAELTRLQHLPELIELVKSRTKKSIQRTPSIPILCGKELTGEYVAFLLRDGAVHLALLDGLPTADRGSGEPSMDYARILTEEAAAVPHTFHHCYLGMKARKMTHLEMFTLAALALTSKNRHAGIQLHT
ncbi:hypothetical protein IWX78_001330 [Mycetocola sp. CAN_C7]|uniref:hypothetical protein n=1 Tax=Mycetocola sp. CAN_C7 TaxID=2787724 RepID=UPI0018C99BD6